MKTLPGYSHQQQKKNNFAALTQICYCSTDFFVIYKRFLQRICAEINEHCFQIIVTALVHVW